MRSILPFLWQQAASCLFAAFIFLALGATQAIEIVGLPRYDLLFLLCVLMQGLMYWTGLETKDEIKVIAVFHLLGLTLELFKTHHHSWQYPEFAWLKIGGVPLYSGFMYASVASYMCQAWRRFRLEIAPLPPAILSLPLALAIYLNFFTEHLLPDLRWLLLALIAFVFRRSRMTFFVQNRPAQMPLPLTFGLIGLGLWTAENIATFLGAWQYPDQHRAWHLVHASKISSWSMLAIITFLIVAHLKRYKETNHKDASVPGTSAGRRSSGLSVANPSALAARKSR